MAFVPMHHLKMVPADDLGATTHVSIILSAAMIVTFQIEYFLEASPKALSFGPSPTEAKKGDVPCRAPTTTSLTRTYVNSH